MNQLELLWEYQLSDVEVYNMNRTIKRSPRRLKLLKLRDSLKDLQHSLKEIEDEVLAMMDRTDALKDAISLVEDQLRQLQARVQETPAEGSEDARGYIDEAQRLVDNLDEYDQEIRRIRKNAADRDRRQRDIKLRAVLSKQEFDELRVEYEEEYREKSAVLERLTALAEEKRKDIDQTYIDKYNAIKQHCMPPIARMTDGQCGGCNMAFPSSVLLDIRAGKIVECETCGRMILG